MRPGAARAILNGMSATLLGGVAVCSLWLPCALAQAQSDSPTFADPVRLQADGAPIEIGRLSSIAHAGPWLGDFTGDGVRDLLVGDFPGYFWLF